MIDKTVPDFVKILSLTADSAGYSVTRLPDESRESYLVGYRGANGPELALVTDSLIGYRKTAVLSLPGGAVPTMAFPKIYLWPDGLDGMRAVAVMEQAEGWNTAYTLLVSDAKIALVERMTPMSDVPPQYIVVGQEAGSSRSAVFGDLDSDGVPNELLLEIRQDQQSVRYEAYELKDGLFAWRADLAETAAKTAALFEGAVNGSRTMLMINAVSESGPSTILNFPESR
jgi:hypothetical protein